MKTIDEDGTIHYYNNKRQLHREDGPAVERWNGDKFWYINGELHREDGPAVECANGYKSWWINGQNISCKTQEKFERLLKVGRAFW